MRVRSWFESRRRKADADALKRAEEESVETPDERAHGEGNRYGEAADDVVARRAGLGGVKDVDRLGDF